MLRDRAAVVERRALPGRCDRLAWITQRRPLVAALVVAGGVAITARSLLAA